VWWPDQCSPRYTNCNQRVQNFDAVIQHCVFVAVVMLICLALQKQLYALAQREAA
jgi:hypothetical protein